MTCLSLVNFIIIAFEQKPSNLSSIINVLFSLASLTARSISDDLSSGDAARFRDDEYGKAETSGMGASSSARNESAHKGDKDKEKKEKDKEDRDEGEMMSTLSLWLARKF